MIDADLLKILACPFCRGAVEHKAKSGGAKDGKPLAETEDKIICLQCGRKYPIKNGIPVMLVDEAEKR